MAAALLALGLILPAALPAAAGLLAPDDLDLYRQAFRAADQERWSEARTLAARGRDRLPAKILHWIDLTRGDSPADFATITDFIRANPGWPNQNGLKRQAEAALPAEMPAAAVKGWFATVAPVTAAGVARYAEALQALGEEERAAQLVRKHWIEGSFNPEEESDFRTRFRSLLRGAEHRARLDRLLWEHQEVPARRMVPLVDDDQQALAEARLALFTDAPGIEYAVQRVPAALANDPGLLYERLRWRRRKDNDSGALELLAAYPHPEVRPALWWTERHILARRAIERGDVDLAYRLARDHGQSETQPLAEGEFLAGWLALRRLHRSADAFQHFQRLYQAVQSPMSRSRGAYWSGRAAEAMGDRRLADEWYTRAVRHSTMFYGQMAALALGSNRLPLLPPEPAVSREDGDAFSRRELVRAARLLAEIDPRDPADRVGLFLRKLSQDSDGTAAQYVLIARLGHELHHPDIAIQAAKQGVQRDLNLGALGYPLLEASQAGAVEGGVEPALVLALIRQESTFNPNIVSSAGARGLMQLMPATAKLVAGKLGLRHTDARLISDPGYNVQLGSNYIGELIRNYDGAYIMAIAAYNAGLGRVRGWVEKFGDPRRPNVDPLDWIESIPIAETRNYVQRVLEALQVYRVRLNHGRGERTLSKDLRP